jgi:hypothetical protein
MQAKESYETLRNSNLDLFKNISLEEFNEYLTLSNQIEILANKKNNTTNEIEIKNP